MFEMKILRNLLLLVLFLNPLVLMAQLEAVTTEGKTVLLFENGTWKYKDEAVTINEFKTDLNSNFSGESEMVELFYANSQRLVKYFGNLKGKIKCRAICKIDSGQAKIYFQWEVGLIDSYRYFGNMKAGRELWLQTRNGEEIALVISEDAEIEFLEKYNYSVLKGTCLLTEEQFQKVMNSDITELKVGWKKEAESYVIKDPWIFKKMFTSILNE